MNWIEVALVCFAPWDSLPASDSLLCFYTTISIACLSCAVYTTAVGLFVGLNGAIAPRQDVPVMMRTLFLQPGSFPG